MRVPGSFRDPSGHIFIREGVVLRQVDLSYQEHYDFLINSGLYDELIGSGLLVPHEEVDLDGAQSATGYRVLKPQPVPFISYPYDWCFSQLKDAALTTLEIQKTAFEFGMTLKDASAYNIQFLNGRPVLIDTLSFEKYRQGTPWVAYRQFCQHFLAPLALISYGHSGLGQLSRIYIDGVPLGLASSLLPMRTRLKPSIQAHIHLHARFQERFADKADAIDEYSGTFKPRSFLGLIDSLEGGVKGLRWQPHKTEWVNYYDDNSYTQTALSSKVAIVSGFLNEVKPKSVWDLGANTGLFSRLASDQGIETISFDRDPATVEVNYRETIVRNEANLLPLILDLTNPSPGIGWANRERMELAERGPADMVFALAVIHHLAISENIPIHMIAEYFSALCNWAIVEFVPKSDQQLIRMLATREDIFPAYTEKDFEREFEIFFDIKAVERIEDSQRTLYLMRRK